MDLRKTTVIFLCTINCLAFVTEKQRTYSAERAQILHITHSSLIICSFPTWNTAPSWRSSIWFHLSLALLQFPFYCSSPGCSWSASLHCTLRVSVQCVYFNCNVWFTYCVVNPTPFLAFIWCSIGVLVVYVLYGRSNATFIPLYFVLCHNSSY
jgi:hypothetical protein